MPLTSVVKLTILDVARILGTSLAAQKNEVFQSRFFQ